MKTTRVAAMSVVAAATMLSLAACSAGAGTAASSSTSGKASGLIFVITPAPSNIFFKAEADAAAQEARKLGYSATEVSHDDDPTKQSNLIDTAISRHAKAIILDNAGADVSEGPIQKATKAGIPVFLIDREINKTGLAKAQIVSNNAQGANDIAVAFEKAVGPNGTWIQLTGLPTDTNATVRENGVDGVLSQYPGLKKVASEAANWDQQTAFNDTQTLLQKYPTVSGIVADNDTMALGVIAALKQAGLAGKVKVVGFDGSPDAAAAIKAGTMVADEVQPATLLATMAVDQADKYLRTGKTGAAEKQSVNCETMDSTNVANYTLFSVK